MRSVRRGVLAGVVGQVALLVLLNASAGLGPAGWSVGLLYALAGGGLLLRALLRSGARVLGAANRVTLVRAVLVGGVAALVADSFSRPAPAPLLVPLAAVALVLDAVDGRVARRTGTVSAVGGRFDMEVDAFLILALAVLVAPVVGVWVLGVGAARYVFGLAGEAVPLLSRSVPASRWRKAVAAVQGIALTTLAAGLLPLVAAETVAGAAAALLAASFGHQVVLQARAGSYAAQELPLVLEPARG